MIRESIWMLTYIGKSIVYNTPMKIRRMSGWKRFWAAYRDYKKMAPADRQVDLSYLYPCIGDDTGETDIEPIYFYQDSWAFEKIVRKRPEYHIDVGSHHKYVALLSKVVPLTMVDIRPLSLKMDTLQFKKGSILDLPFEDASVPSVSSMCVIEHIGLGRYGDPLDPDGSEKSIEELKRIVQPGGDLYISVPIDTENRIHYNAHRAFEEKYLLRLFEPFELIESRYIYGREFLCEHRAESGTGCYHLKRPANR